MQPPEDPPAAVTPPDPLTARVEEAAAAYLRRKGTVGLAVGVLQKDGARFFGYGRCARDREQAPGPDTLFEIGSITKVYTATLLADMVRTGQVSLEDPAQDYLSEEVWMPAWEGGKGEPVRLVHLATHTSGLPRLPSNLRGTIRDMQNPYAGYTVEHLHAALSRCRLRSAPGVRAEYSNLGAGLLGHLLARAAGSDYEDLVRERICRPLGLADTGIALTPELRARLAAGHSAAGDPVSNWDLPTLAGAGALRSTPREVLAFLAANVAAPEGPLGESLRLCQEPRPRIPARMPAWERALRILFWAFVAAHPWWAARPTGLALLLFAGAVLASGWKAGKLAGGFTALGALLIRAAWFDRLPPNPDTLWPFLQTGAVFCLGGAGLGRLGMWARGWLEDLEDRHALGWFLRSAERGRVLHWHNGGTGGYASFAGFDRAAGTAVVVLANSAHPVDGIGFQLLETS